MAETFFILTSIKLIQGDKYIGHLLEVKNNETYTTEKRALEVAEKGEIIVKGVLKK